VTSNVDVQPEVKQPPPPSWKMRLHRTKLSSTSLTDSVDIGNNTSSASGCVSTISLTASAQNAAVGRTTVGEVMDTASASASSVTASSTVSTSVTCIPVSAGASTTTVASKSFPLHASSSSMSSSWFVPVSTSPMPVVSASLPSTSSLLITASATGGKTQDKLRHLILGLQILTTN